MIKGVLRALFSLTQASASLRLALAAQRRPAVTGAEGLFSETGEVLTPITPHAPGRVRLHGEIWTAIASEPIASGERVKVTHVDGLTLTVRKE